MVGPSTCACFAAFWVTSRRCRRAAAATSPHAQYEFPWEILDHGLAGRGRDAVRRINRIHARYAITNEDYLYVLSNFVVVPLRWLDRYGWRRVSEAERRATFLYYREIGRHMGITGIPASYDELAAFSDAYEREHFRYSDGSRRTAEAERLLPSRTTPVRTHDHRTVKGYRDGYDIDSLGPAGA